MPRQSLTPYRSNAPQPYQGNPLLSLHREVNRMFDDVFRDFGGTREEFSGVLAPRIDITEDEKETRITAELPGVKEEDVDLSVEGDIVTLRAEKRIERDENKERRHVSERAYGTFQRSLRLPYPVDADAVRAHFDHGVLTICLPRNEQEERRRRIEIQSGSPDKSKEAGSKAHH